MTQGGDSLSNKLLYALDLGTTKFCLAAYRPGAADLNESLKIVSVPAEGMHRGMVSSIDGAKKALRIPLKCPKCKGSLEHWLAKKMYKIHGFCFDCTVDMEADLRKAGLYEDYERRMITGNIKEFVKDIENWVINSLDDKNSFVTEAGDVEDWGNMSNKAKKEILDNLKGYTDHIRKQL